MYGKHCYLSSGSLFQDTLGLFFFRHFKHLAYLSEKDHCSTPSLFFYTISPYHIENWTFENWLKTKMGASSSSASATGENAKTSDQTMSNYGLVNVADTGDSENDFTFNLVELFTCLLAVLIGIFLLRFCCIRKRHQNLLRMQRNVADAVQQVVVAPHAARLPVLSGPPPTPAHAPQPVYPLQELPPYSAQKTPSEQIGAAVMKQYM